jgi:catechol 2,3-dioxygenase-like lactoylglutathione lyase family enzyme
MKLDAVGVVSTDFAKTTAFYTLLGFTFPPYTEKDLHLEALRKEGEPRLMIDDKGTITEHAGFEPVPSNFPAFAIACDSPREVDGTMEKVRAAGFTVAKEPWDAMWGQRYATVVDPDGYGVDLFAPLT